MRAPRIRLSCRRDASSRFRVYCPAATAVLLEALDLRISTFLAEAHSSGTSAAAGTLQLANKFVRSHFATQAVRVLFLQGPRSG